jgi:DNA primase
MINPIPYFESKRIEYHLPGEDNVSRGWVNIQCPFPTCGDHKWHCGVNLESGMFNCYICGNSGHFTKLITLLEKCSFSKSQTLYKHLLDSKSSWTNPAQAQRSVKIYTEGHYPLESTETFHQLHLNYLKNRGFDFPERIIEKYKLRACFNIGKFKFRIIIPYFLNGQLVTFTARDIMGGGITYKDCPPEESAIPVKETLYNIDNVKDRILIVEGPGDVWKIGDGAVATSTTNYSKGQVEMLKRLKNKGVKKIFIMFDAEKNAIKKAEKLAWDLESIYGYVEVIKLSSPGDPGEMNEGEVRYLRKELGL